MPAILDSYAEVENVLGRNDGEWCGCTTDTYDLIEALFDGYDGTDTTAVIDTLREAITDQLWCRQDAYGVQAEDADFYQWQAFSRMVKHSSRYFFHELVLPDDGGEYSIVKANGFLRYLKQVLQDEFLTQLGLETVVWRGRVDDKRHNEPRELGAPAPEKAGASNRMSPSGISMFYGADNRATAITEIGEVEEGKILSLAMFQLIRKASVLDFTKLPPSPDFFELEKKQRRCLCSFLSSFVEDLRKPIQKDGREHIDYVHTQVLTEYLKSSLPIDGMLFPSARNRGGTCIVLWGDGFVPDWRGDSTGLVLRSVDYVEKGLEPVELGVVP